MSTCLEENNRIELSPIAEWNNFPSCLVTMTSTFHIWHAQKVSNLHLLSRSRCFDFEELLANLFKLQTYNLAECDGIEPSPATNQWNSFQGCLLTMNSTLHNSWRIIIESNNHLLLSGTVFEAA